MEKLAAFRKLSKSGLDSVIKPLADQGHCCEEPENAIVTYANTAHNLGATTLDSIVIDGTTYTFTTAASTVALLETGIREAFTAAGYAEVFGVAVTITGGDAAAVATIKTTATLTKFVDSGASDVALTAQ